MITKAVDVIAKQIDKKSFKSELEAESQGIMTFYERWIQKIPFNDPIAKLLIACISLTSVTFALHVIFGSIVGEEVTGDFSFLLPVMHGFCLFVLTYGTWRIKRYSVELADLAQDQYLHDNKYRENFVDLLKNKINGYSLAPWGIAFALINTLVGFVFGPYYQDPLLNGWLQVQHFLIGFLCGLAVGGIYIILVMTHRAGEIDLAFSYYHPDKCGGTSVIGNLLFTFSMITLMMGVLISNYIIFSEWANAVRPANTWDTPFAGFIYHFWISWPFILSILVFVFPILKIHGKLKKYKESEQSVVREKLKLINEKLLRLDYESDDKLAQAEGYIAYSEKLKGIDDMISSMNSWPYTKKQQQTFFSIFPVTTIASTEIRQFLDTIIDLGGG